ncbi:exo-alpha-sialidase [Ekhidna sp.]|uniref:exo-alpha-sialidase n=1 Tax=Ekhidna sp. TaxID=2608089 RepID=UPI003518DF20
MRNFLTLIALILTWSCTNTTEYIDFKSPAGANASLPHLIKGDDGNLYVSWVEKGDSNQVDFKYSAFTDEKWTDPELIASGNDWFVNWADYPMLAVDQSGNKIAHYLAKSSSGTYSYDVNVVLKSTGSQKWSAPIIPHKDGTPTEHGFVTMLPKNDGTFLLAWLDGRNTGGGGHGDHGSGGAMTIRSAVIDMQGNLSEEIELDERVCDCCQTGGVMTPEGAIIVYRDRSVNEVRDMAFVTKTDTGWSQPKLVAQDNWNIAGCPVNGPRVAASGNTMASAWFTAADGEAKVKVAFAINGDDFEKAFIVDDTSPIGRVDVVMMDETTAVVSWLDGGESSTINYRMVKKDGTMTEPVKVAETSDSRGSGFPQMEIHNNQLYFAWTALHGDNLSIKMARFDLQD